MHIENLVLKNPEPYNFNLRKGLEELGQNLNPQEQKIVSAIINEPLAKIKFEQAKSKLHLGYLDEAVEMLIRGVTTLSNDWRSVYRSFFILATVDNQNNSTWLELGIRCNSEFPVKALKNETFSLSTLG